MIMFFVCLGFVLLLCFLGRCCMIPVVHATNFEINNRAYTMKMDKNTVCQKQIVHNKFEEIVKESVAIKKRNKNKKSEREIESAYKSVAAKANAKDAEEVGGSVSSDPGEKPKDGAEQGNGSES